jgi:hypothetical protein
MKFALLIGSNYINVPNSKLYGCINDIINIKNMLIDAYNYSDSNIVMLRDDIPDSLPTRNNIINYLTNTINQSSNYDEIWIHYSGHGHRITDYSNDENDGYDEVIVPCDYQTSGFIIDDELFNIIKNSKCKTIIIMDCCNSGTSCDLPWSFEKTENSFNKYFNAYREPIENPNIFMISGCKDDQTSNDIYSRDFNQSCGAFTSSFIKSLRNSNHNIDIFTLYINICNELMKNGYANQLPVLSSSSEKPEYTFEKSVIIKSVIIESVTISPENIYSAHVLPKKFETIKNVMDFNMLYVMANKSHRDQNKYKSKKQR